MRLRLALRHRINTLVLSCWRFRTYSDARETQALRVYDDRVLPLQVAHFILRLKLAPCKSAL
jgi:hypothetical protein